VFRIIAGFANAACQSICAPTACWWKIPPPDFTVRCDLRHRSLTAQRQTAMTRSAARPILRQIERGILSFLEQRSDRTPVLRVRMTVSNANAREMRPFYERWHGIADDILSSRFITAGTRLHRLAGSRVEP
jgi:hypothetical protein